MDHRQQITLAALFLIVAGFALRVSAQDVAKCQAATGWTSQHCKTELSR